MTEFESLRTRWERLTRLGGRGSTILEGLLFDGCLLVRSVGGKAMCCGLDGWGCLGGWAAWAALVLELTDGVDVSRLGAFCDDSG